MWKFWRLASLFAGVMLAVWQVAHENWDAATFYLALGYVAGEATYDLEPDDDEQRDQGNDRR